MSEEHERIFLWDEVKSAIERAKRESSRVLVTFNNVTFEVDPTTTLLEGVVRFEEAMTNSVAKWRRPAKT